VSARHPAANQAKVATVDRITAELEASRVAESDTVLAVRDTGPVTAGHVLVMPKAHLPL
jgi:diadenosine tetraphosphate (Ap4A) HIT family hydrolase